ncbi:hypothetical protein [Sphingobacterium psychroaquaticum]|uniref:Acyl carrier protein phosphodiesterase n=1 Tax=Sphingobacterium psychroaquaticum TaxID=561061 RepID=A0A1X7J3K8_9SPHI|nr:hypothetical protein [Sphingobacterium psychroaquaticum]SMG21816.1 hypothetical protein SAMN05660862_1377 [Sphingobacterium psychroaquaticum]
MNFLSHYYFERYTGHSERVLGGLLPDLLKNVDKGYNFQPQRYESLFFNSPDTTHILEGWYRHVEVDKLFHGSPYFLNHCHVLRKLLVPVLAGTPIRPSFMAHIAVELLLDHLLIAEDLVNPLRLYEHLEAVKRPVLQRSIEILETVDVARFMVFYDRFLESKYIVQYAEIPNLSYALFNICKRIWAFEVDAEQREALTIVLRDYCSQNMHDFRAVFLFVQDGLT